MRICDSKINPSKFNHRLQLQQVTQTPDGAGGYTESWALVSSLWASIDPIRGREKMQGMQLETPITHKIFCRYNSAVTTKKRFLLGSRVFNIVEVLNIEEQNQFLEILAVEGS